MRSTLQPTQRPPSPPRVHHQPLDEEFPDAANIADPAGPKRLPGPMHHNADAKSTQGGKLTLEKCGPIRMDILASRSVPVHVPLDVSHHLPYVPSSRHSLAGSEVSIHDGLVGGGGAASTPVAPVAPTRSARISSAHPASIPHTHPSTSSTC